MLLTMDLTGSCVDSSYKYTILSHGLQADARVIVTCIVTTINQ